MTSLPQGRSAFCGAVLLTALFVINLLCSVVLGAEPIKRQFDLPADGINQSMKRFAAQSGLEVLYPTDSVTGIRTKPVQGEMPAREALAVMLAGTGLEVVQDPRNGALTVRKSDPNGDRAAQTSDRSKSEEKIEDVPVRLGRFEVMESKILNMDIKRSRDDAQPYAIFDRKTIEQSGATMLDDFLKNQLPMNTIGRSNNQAVGGTAGSRSQVNLRGLGTNQTLILIDGRRAASVSNAGFPGQPDINGIPLAAIERIEVLPTTASGIYGGSATGGVINIILRRDYSGAEFKLTYDNTFRTDSAMRRAEVSAGFTLEQGKTNILVAASFSDQGYLLGQDRDLYRRGRGTVLANNRNDYAIFKSGATLPLGSTTNIESATGANLTLKSNGTSLGSPRTFVPIGYAGTTDGGAALVANAGRFNLDISNDAVLFSGGRIPFLVAPRSEAITATARRQFSPRLQAFAEAAASNVTSLSELGLALANNFPIPASAPNNPFQQNIVVRVPSASTDATLRSLSYTRRLAVGSIARLGADWQAGADYTWSNSRFAYASVPDALLPAAAAAVASGAIQVLRDTNLYPVDFSPYAIDGQRTGKPFRTAIHNVALRGSGPVIALPAGPARLSALLEWRDERFGEGLIILPRLNETRFNPERSQMVTSISAQLLTPIVSERNRRFGVHEFELQLAGRFDEYTTHGVTGLVSSLTPVTVARVRNTARSTEPTVAIRYRPVADVTIRASFGTGFLPPGVHQLIPSPPNFTANFFDPRRGNTRPGLVSNVTGGNPALQPERSESRSAGIIVMPHVLPGFRLSVDYTRINKKDNIAGFNFQQTVDNEALLPNRVQRGPNLPGDPPGWPGPITFIDATSLNISQAEVEAYDLQLDYDRPTATLGTFSFLAMATWQTHYKTQVISSSPIVENVGYFYSNPLKLKGNLGLTWRRGALTLGWRARYFDGYRVYLPTASAAAKAALVLSQGSEEVSSQIYHDLFWSYRFGGKGSSTARRILSGTELSGGFRNIFNRMPAYDASQSVTGYYSFLGDPRMASYYLSVKRSF